MDWNDVSARLANISPGSELDDYLDEIADAALTGNQVSVRASVLVQALTLARSELTIRSVALALAITASDNSDDATDALVTAFRRFRTHAFLAPALLEALSVLAIRSPIARAEMSAILIRLHTKDVPHLLVKAAQIIGRFDPFRHSDDLRAKLDQFDDSKSTSVQAEVATQRAFLMLNDALETETFGGLRETLVKTRQAFSQAERMEEHRPDAVIFSHLLEMVDAFFALPDDRIGVTHRLEALEEELRTVVVNQWWPDYRSDAAQVCVARVLSISDALLRGARSARDAEEWTNFDAALSELAALYAAIQARAYIDADGRAIVGEYTQFADLVFAPSLGPVLRSAVGRRRLTNVAQNYTAEHGDDEVADGLRAFVRIVDELDRLTPSGTLDTATFGQQELPLGLMQLAAAVGQSPEELIRSFLDARERAKDDTWVTRLGAGDAPLPVDLPLAFGGNGAIHEITRRLLSEVNERLGEYPQRKWIRFVTALEAVVGFARHVFNASPKYLLCAADGGKGQTASESDLQEDLFRWLRQWFGDQAVYEFTPVAGGRVDTGLLFPELRIPIEVKCEYSDVTRERVQAAYLTQTDMYAAGTDRIAMLFILDLRESLSQSHRDTRKKSPASPRVDRHYSLYTVDEGFWVDALLPDPQILGSRSKAVVIGMIPGNRPKPSHTSKYSKRPRPRRSEPSI